jgi:NhaP-type Na+/H+ or K+/H+ antiporter
MVLCGAKGVDVRSGFVLGFIAGVTVCVIVANDQIGGIFTLIGALAEGVAVILNAADGAGIIGVLAVIGIGLIGGRNWSENRRGRKEADAAWDRRKTFR